MLQNVRLKERRGRRIVDKEKWVKNLIEQIQGASIMMIGQQYDAEQWERIRAEWIELGIKIASSKAPDVDNADEYTTLEEVRIENFDDAMKVLK